MAPRREDHHSLCYAATLAGISKESLRLCVNLGFLEPTGKTWDGREGFSRASVQEAKEKLRTWRQEHRLIRENSVPAHFCDHCEQWKPIGAFHRPGICNTCHKKQQTHIASLPKF